MNQPKSLPVRIVQSWKFLLLLPIYVIGSPIFAILNAYVRTLEWLFKFTKHGNARFLPLDIYPWTSTLQDNWLTIRGELDGILTNLDDIPNYQDIAPSQRVLTRDDKWKSVVLSMMGQPIQENARICPETAKLIGSIPGLLYAMFSVLKPDKHIAGHRGAYSGVLNCHLALRVPPQREQCEIRVADELRNWEEGRMLVFNDRYEHEAWNRSDEVRVVLLMYVVRPLPFPLAALNRSAIWTSQYFLGSELSRIRKLANEAGKKAVRQQTAAVARN